MNQLISLPKNIDDVALHTLPDSVEPVFVASTPGTRRICNDSSFRGVAYTEALEESCARILKELTPFLGFGFTESETVVLHVLRGGLNFGLRNALHRAFSWNRHGSAFVSAQRARASHDPEQWHITESDYRKVYLPDNAFIVLGDVVATGTSLEHALRELVLIAKDQRKSLSGLLFFTFGGERAENIMREIASECRDVFPNFRGAATVYLEGRFTVAQAHSPVTIKLTGTDLLRRDALLAPEFLESQYENPAFPLERCAIYDAGSRAFWLPEFEEDVANYWRDVRQLAEQGMSFEGLLNERFPALDVTRFGEVSLVDLARMKIQAND